MMTRNGDFEVRRYDLRSSLRWCADRYTPYSSVRERIVDRTISIMSADPALLDGVSVHAAVFRVLHTVALQEIAAISPSFHQSVNIKLPLGGRRYLIVEDDYLIASDMMSLLERAGAKVYGPVSDVERALEVIADRSFRLDGAILDVNLDGEMVYPAAELLIGAGTPYVFVTGFDCAVIPREHAKAPCLTKPYDERALVRALATLPPSSHLTGEPSL